jgi:uncharacterized membrane protein YfcA
VDYGLIFLGFLIGGLIGLSGMGGGSLLAPLLIGVAGVRPLNAVGTDFVFSAVTKLLGGWRHWRHGSVDRVLVLRLAAASVPGLIAGVLLLRLLDAQAGARADAFITRMLGVTLLLAALATGWRALRPGDQAHTASRRTRWLLLIPGGFVLGLLVGVTSVGSGSLYLVLLAAATPLSLRRAVGTDVAHAALLTGAGALAHLSAHTVDPRITLNLLAGSLPGVWLGSGLTARLPRRTLSVSLAAVLAISGLHYL